MLGIVTREVTLPLGDLPEPARSQARSGVWKGAALLGAAGAVAAAATGYAASPKKARGKVAAYGGLVTGATVFALCAILGGRGIRKYDAAYDAAQAAGSILDIFTDGEG